MINPESWPTDPDTCHDLLRQLAQQVDDLQAALDHAATIHDQALQERDQTIAELRHQLELYRRYVFGPRRERITDAPGVTKGSELYMVTKGSQSQRAQNYISNNSDPF